MAEEEQPIFNGENYRNTDNYGFKTIVLKQVSRIVNIYSQELTKGFTKYSQPSSSGHQQVVSYISDGRVAYCQSVEVLYDLLQPKFDSKIKEASEVIEAEIEVARKKDDTKSIDAWRNEKVIYKRKLFQELCLFLERLGWLEETAIEDE